MLNAKMLTNYVMKNDKKSEILHSSGYAQAQSGSNVGAASTESFAARKAIDEKRKFVQGYNNSRIMNDYYGAMRARVQAGRTNSTYRKNTVATEANNPMDTAMNRARFSASRGAGPVAANAKAPQIPMRRMGI